MTNRFTVAAYGKATLLFVLLLLALPSMGAPREGPPVVPDNAYSNGQSYGSGWACSFGYQLNGDNCKAIAVPANGYLNARGDGWKCNRGYRLVGFGVSTCQKIVVPSGGYLSESNSKNGWDCEREFRANDEACERIIVPDNGFLTNSSRGSGWECERGYRAGGESCMAIAVPANAYMTDAKFGREWQCDRGYSTVDDKTCNKLNVPTFGHLDRTGNGWLCNRPYEKKRDTCVLQ